MNKIIPVISLIALTLTSLNANAERRNLQLMTDGSYAKNPVTGDYVACDRSYPESRCYETNAAGKLAASSAA